MPVPAVQRQQKQQRNSGNDQRFYEFYQCFLTLHTYALLSSEPIFSDPRIEGQ